MIKIVNGVEIPLTQDEISSISAENLEREPAKVRIERDSLLAASDTYALSDRITDEWRTYRQALRDLPSQAGFPYSTTWPTKP